MSDYFHDAWKKVLQEMSQRLQDEACAMEPVLVGTIHREYPEGSGYIIYEELGTPSNTVDSTATVIDENVKALPAPTEEMK